MTATTPVGRGWFTISEQHRRAAQLVVTTGGATLRAVMLVCGCRPIGALWLLRELQALGIVDRDERGRWVATDVAPMVLAGIDR